MCLCVISLNKQASPHCTSRCSFLMTRFGWRSTRCHRLAASGAPICTCLRWTFTPWSLIHDGYDGWISKYPDYNKYAPAAIPRFFAALLGNLRIEVWLENPQLWRISRRRFLNHRFTKLENYAIKITRIDSNHGLESSNYILYKSNIFLWAMAQIWVQKKDLLQVFESSTETPGVWAKALGAWRIGSLREKRAIGQNDDKTA